MKAEIIIKCGLALGLGLVGLAAIEEIGKHPKLVKKVLEIFKEEVGKSGV